MGHKILIDAADDQSTRMVVLDQRNEIQEFDQEIEDKLSLKGNIYLATITRVEPSLQAAFVNFGHDRHGFLSFSEIHPDYFRIPVADRKRIIAEQAQQNDAIDEDDAEYHDSFDRNFTKKYKIQEVISSGQVILVQVTKEGRNNKGAAVSTYLSLAGSSCVLMPNDSNASGVSRKISNQEDRARLRKLVNEIPMPESMSLIIRTAGGNRTNDEILRDYDYLVKTWNSIRRKTLESRAPALIHADGDLIVRAIRDYSYSEIEQIYVVGREAYERVIELCKQLLPGLEEQVVYHDADKDSYLFQNFNIERRLVQLLQPRIQLPSGGYIVIHQTEALVAIDVNSGRATSERDIEGTALNTNFEAAHEVARQLKLRNLSGLIVIDFIDMVEYRNVRSLEQRTRELFRQDRARVQIRTMSQFGMMEMSRQRLHQSQGEQIQDLCPHCQGSGFVLSPEWTATLMIRMAQEELANGKSAALVIETSEEVFSCLVNSRNSLLAQMPAEERKKITIKIGRNLGSINFKMLCSAIYDRNNIPQELAPADWINILERNDQEVSKIQYRRNGRSRRSTATSGRDARRSTRHGRKSSTNNSYQRNRRSPADRQPHSERSELSPAPTATDQENSADTQAVPALDGQHDSNAKPPAQRRRSYRRTREADAVSSSFDNASGHAPNNDNASTSAAAETKDRVEETKMVSREAEATLTPATVKPRQRRNRSAEDSAPVDSSPVDSSAAFRPDPDIAGKETTTATVKPVRRRSRKTSATEPLSETTSAATQPSESVVAKPRRTRRKPVAPQLELESTRELPTQQTMESSVAATKKTVDTIDAGKQPARRRRTSKRAGSNGKVSDTAAANTDGNSAVNATAATVATDTAGKRPARRNARITSN